MKRIRTSINLAFFSSLVFSASLTAAPTSLYSLTVLSNNPVAYWRLDETNSNTAYDLVGGHNGTNIGGITFSVPGAIFNDPDTCYGFNGASGKIDVPFSTTLNPKTFAIELWARCTGGAGTYRSPMTSRNNSPLNGFLFYAATNDTWQFWIAAGGSSWETIAGPAVVLGQWVYLAGTYDGTNQTFYVNGQAVGTAQVSYTPNSARLLRIGAGASESTGNYWFPGNIDEVAIYNHALSASQVAADYQAGIDALLFTNSTLHGANLVLAGMGGASNGPYTLLAATNLAMPLTNWTVVATNSFDTNGHFSLTNPVNPAVKRQFYALRTLPASSPLWVPACGAWLGSTDDNSTTIEGQIGRPLDIIHFYNGIQTNLTSAKLTFITNGQKLLINFIPATNWAWAVGVANGGKSSVDQAMTNFAKSVAGINPAQVMLIVLGEQERYVTGGGGNGAPAGTAAQYAAMSQNVWNIFRAVGATNVIWCWDIEGCCLRNLLPSLWPGNSYVDWVMWDPYQDSSTSFTNKVMGDYNWLLDNSTPTCNWASKPWGLAEWGIGLNTNWIPTAADQTNAFNQLNNAVNNNLFPKLSLLAMFDESYSVLLSGAAPAYSNFANSSYMKQQCSH